MNIRTRIVSCCLLVTGWIYIGSAITYSQEATSTSSNQTALTKLDQGSRLFPSDTPVFLQVNDAGALIDRALSHPVRETVEQIGPIEKSLNTHEFMAFLFALGLVESQLETDWLSAVKSLGGNGVFLGFDLATQQGGIAIHAADEDLLKKAMTVLLRFIKNQAGEGVEPFKVSDYQGGKIAEFEGQATIGRFGKWLLISNDSEYLKQMANRFNHSQDSLFDSKSFQAARTSVPAETDGWLYANLESIRASQLADDLFRGRTDEAAVELLFGGLLEGLKDAAWLAAEFSFGQDQIALNARLPFDSNQVPAEREFFFGTRGLGRAPAPIDIPGVIMQTTAYRNLGAWWLSKEDLFPENVVAELAQSDSQLSTVFGGIDFGAEVLGTLQAGMRLIVKDQQYPDGIQPETQLPSFALVTRMQNPEQARRFRISFQSLVGILNLAEGGMDRPQIDLMSTREDGVQITAGIYEPEAGYSGDLMIFNFSPTVAFQDDFMIISSTESLARELAFKTKELPPESDCSDSNTTVSINMPETVKILAKNRNALIANQMLEKGIDRTEAEGEIDLALELMKLFDAADLDYRIEPEQMKLKIELKFQKP